MLRTLLPLLFACVTLSAKPAHAIVSTNNSDWAPTSLDTRLGLPETALNGVARMYLYNASNALTGGCSGSLLSGGWFVLTAAHCVTNDSTGVLDVARVTLNFNGVATASVSSTSQMIVRSGWNGTIGQNNDLALLRLDQKVTNLPGYQLWDSTHANPMNSTVLIAGYGETGLAATGNVAGTFGNLRWGLNQYDFSTTAGTYLWDFDNGTTQYNSAKNGGFKPTSSTGLGELEANIGPGDSGGGSFIVVSNNLYLAGVHSYGLRYSNLDLDAAVNFGTGEFGADTTVYGSGNGTWAAMAAVVPEPSDGAMTLAGLALVACCRRRSVR